MSEYAKKKNDELSALCKERGLPHNGKKADLVKRLEEYDANATTTAEPAKNANEDEIDWDEDPATNPPRPGTTEPAKTTASNDGAASANEPATSTQPDEQSSANNADTTAVTLAAEIEKRKQRARRFGMPEDTEEIKMLERALRFGSTEVPGLLNKALTTDKKRGSTEADGGVQKKSKGRPGPGKSQNKTPASGATKTPKPAAGKTEGGYPAWMSAEDRAKADQRKAKWAQPTTTAA